MYLIYTHFSDYWLRTSVVFHVYKARARRNGYRMFISVYTLRNNVKTGQGQLVLPYVGVAGILL